MSVFACVCLCVCPCPLEWLVGIEGEFEARPGHQRRSLSVTKRRAPPRPLLDQKKSARQPLVAGPELVRLSFPLQDLSRRSATDVGPCRFLFFSFFRGGRRRPSIPPRPFGGGSLSSRKVGGPRSRTAAAARPVDTTKKKVSFSRASSTRSLPKPLDDSDTRTRAHARTHARTRTQNIPPVALTPSKSN